MGTADYRKTEVWNPAVVRRAVFWYRVRVWALVVSIVTIPSALLCWMIWSLR